mmetsp:Transcript_22366/g.61983  ORF Transcript_22366/g.61983 Transcript_22366/m.61983 type:complete len:301 (+) Transcript_22366:589-1491(+)
MRWSRAFPMIRARKKARTLTPLALSRQKRGLSMPKSRSEKTALRSARAVWRLRYGSADQSLTWQMNLSMVERISAARTTTPRKSRRSSFPRHHCTNCRCSRMASWPPKPEYVRALLYDEEPMLKMLDAPSRRALSLPVEAPSGCCAMSRGPSSSGWSAGPRKMSSSPRRYSMKSCFCRSLAPGGVIPSNNWCTTSRSGSPPRSRPRSWHSSSSSREPFPFASICPHSASRWPAVTARSSPIVQPRDGLGAGSAFRSSQSLNSISLLKSAIFEFGTSFEITSIIQSAGFSSAGMLKPRLSK